MKKKIACLSLLFVSSFAFLSGCNEADTSKDTSSRSSSSTDSVQSSSSSNSISSSGLPTLTQEELFDKWIKGRDYFASYFSDYSLTYEEKEYIDGEFSYRTEDKFGQKGNEFYQIHSFARIDNESETLMVKSVTALKNVEVDGNAYSKLYRENMMGEQSNIEGSYVSPDYLETMKVDWFGNLIDIYCIGKGDTYSSFVDELTKEYVSSGDYIDNISFSENNGLIDLTITSHGEYIDNHNSDEGYQKTSYESISTISCKDGKLATFISDYKEKEYYSDKTNESRDVETTSLSYGFDQTLFDSISIETEETKNYYYAPVGFYIEGEPFKYSDDAYVYQTYDVSKARNFIVSGDHHFVITSKDYPFANYIDVYTDEDYVTPFTSMDVSNDERVNLYAKFNLPEDLAMVIIVFKNATRSWIYLAYPIEVGKAYDTGFSYSEYDVYSIDGVRYEEGGSKQFECKENKAYVVVFDTPELLG